MIIVLGLNKQVNLQMTMKEHINTQSSAKTKLKLFQNVNKFIRRIQKPEPGSQSSRKSLLETKDAPKLPYTQNEDSQKLNKELLQHIELQGKLVEGIRINNRVLSLVINQTDQQQLEHSEIPVNSNRETSTSGLF